VLVAIHDTTLDRSTNAVDLWGPGPHRVQDYTLAEIKQLTVKPTGPANSSFPGFTPSTPNAFEVPTFQEVLDFLTGYNAANGTSVGIYPEAKQPTSTLMHTQIVTQLRDAGFTSAADRVFIQSFSFGALSELDAIQTALGTDMRQVALGVALETPLGYGLLNVASGEGGFFPLASLADRAQGLGVIIGDLGGFGLTNALSAEFVAAAHALGFEVHGWTFRPTTLDAASDLFGLHIAMGMDGFFTDYPDFGRIVVDAASVAPVPLPMPVALLAGALGGLFLVRRRRA
jgi:glycerophosphoryl diester phosphodiesterase